jgi:hypothetical protein
VTDPDEVEIVIPEGCGRLAWNSLCRTDDPTCLDKDLVFVELPDGTFIDVSWLPEHGPRGAYRVVRYSADWETELETRSTRSVDEAAAFVQDIARRLVVQ